MLDQAEALRRTPHGPGLPTRRDAGIPGPAHPSTPGSATSPARRWLGPHRRWTDVVGVYLRPARRTSPAGALYIYICQNSSYQKAYQRNSLANFGAPGIRYLQDLNADGKADLVTSQSVCGVSTCFEFGGYLSWMGTGFRNRLTGSADDLPYPDIQVKAAGGDGIYDLIILGGSIGSAGAGPQRGKTRTWKYDSAFRVWAVASDVLEPSSYRVHVLYDADAALRRGEVEAALVAYQQVLVGTSPFRRLPGPEDREEEPGGIRERIDRRHSCQTRRNGYGPGNRCEDGRGVPGRDYRSMHTWKWQTRTWRRSPGAMRRPRAKCPGVCKLTRRTDPYPARAEDLRLCEQRFSPQDMCP